MADLVIKRHDTFPAIKATLEQTNVETGAKEPINLTTALKVTLILKPQSGGAATTEGTCTITSAALGKVEYPLKAKDTETAGIFNLEFEIEWAAGSYETVPNEGYREVEIQADLGVA